MAIIYPDVANIARLKVKPTDGERYLIEVLEKELDDSYEVFFNSFLDGDRPDIIILKEHVGVSIIEVKDWNLSSYKVLPNNKWRVLKDNREHLKASPHSQVFRYKKNLYDLHLPVVGLERLKNPNFFNLVQCFVFFHGENQSGIDALYGQAEVLLNEEMTRLNNAVRNGEMPFDKYDRHIERTNRKRKAMRRDKAMSFGSDRVGSLVKKLRANANHILFDDKVYRDFKRRLRPSEHVIKQGIPINFDDKQLSCTFTDNVHEKVRGVAGCGKSTILAQRAINARNRHNGNVLILTFNITLKNYIRDKISDIQGRRDFESIEISNYHQFFNSQVNNTEQSLPELIEKYGIQKLYRTDVFEGLPTLRYQTILIDEIQDYEGEWVKIIRNNFLAEDSEMVLFGDQSQDIYQRENGRAPVIAQGFGRWKRLTRSYRTDFDSPLNQIFKDFQLALLAEKYPDIEVVDTAQTQMGIGFSLLRYESFPEAGWEKAVFDAIQTYITAYDLHPNDLVILSSSIGIVRELNEFWLEHEKTHCMFETFEELSGVLNRTVEELKRMNRAALNDLLGKEPTVSHVEAIRRAKKNHFYANSGCIKLSTVHSFKGLESKTVFYILRPKDSTELVYTAITRATENLIILDVGSDAQCSGFLKAWMNGKAGENSDSHRLSI